MPVSAIARGPVTSSNALRLELAVPEDDRQLRELLHEMPMGERIAVKFLREPSFFQAKSVLGEQVQVIVGRRGGRIVGFGTRALRRSYINGELTRSGYLSDLRLIESERRGTSLARGYRFLREIHEQDPVDVYSTVIVEDNAAAIATIASGRAGLPMYTPLGRVLTPMIQLKRRLPEIEEHGQVVRGNDTMLPAIVDRLNENRQQCAPIYKVEDFTAGRFPEFSPEDFYVLKRGNRIAAAGVWDQHAFRQTVIDGYGSWLKVARPLVNIARRPKLPPPGTALRYFNVSFVATDDVDALAVLLRRIYNDAIGGPWSHFTIALHERDPRKAVLQDYRKDNFAGRLYAVTFDGPPTLDDRVPHVDAGLL